MLFVQILALAAGAAALSVTSPAAGATISQSDELSISWDTVASDTASFDIHLALSTDAGKSQAIKTGVSPSDKSFKISAAAFPPGTYTINLVGTSKENTGVLAQSKAFTIVQGSTSSSSSSSSSPSAPASSSATSSPNSGTASSSDVPKTSTTTGNTTDSAAPIASGNTTATGSSASSGTPSAPASGSTAAHGSAANTTSSGTAHGSAANTTSSGAHGSAANGTSSGSAAHSSSSSATINSVSVVALCMAAFAAFII
ncbi:putative Xaa-Pro aminopeptidase [Venturia nashicola]|uniref:Putative Xaa-Pro aminopeptidase n=1 Tax=Venturia nashicola TaxID=86259 RepID=A0A4Z1P2S7_9PEZI|nr:putative Xaa-Pro aminopeptidase [Venturia nashicola]TLD27834.1 putative Xaa-Pro aminopeptidase [Venturia nashicola]